MRDGREEDLVDLVGDCVDPFVLYERCGVGEICAFVVRMVEFTRSSEEPFACHLGHGLDGFRGVNAPVRDELVEVAESLEPCIDLVGICVLCVLWISVSPCRC